MFDTLNIFYCSKQMNYGRHKFFNLGCLFQCLIETVKYWNMLISTFSPTHFTQLIYDDSVQFNTCIYDFFLRFLCPQH